MHHYNNDLSTRLLATSIRNSSIYRSDRNRVDAIVWAIAVVIIGCVLRLFSEA